EFMHTQTLMREEEAVVDAHVSFSEWREGRFMAHPIVRRSCLDIYCTAILPDEKLIAGVCDWLQIWDLNTGLCIHSWKAHEGAIHDIAVLPNGQTVSASIDGS